MVFRSRRATAPNYLILLPILLGLVGTGNLAFGQGEPAASVPQEDPVALARLCADFNVDAWRARPFIEWSGLDETQRDCLFSLRGFDVETAEARLAIGEAVAPLLSAPQVETRMQVLLTLGKFAYTPAADQITLSLESTDWREAFAAARTLGALGEVSAIPALRAAGEHHWSFMVRDEAWSSAIALGAEPPLSIADVDFMASLAPDELAEYLAAFEDYRDWVLFRFGLGVEPEGQFYGTAEDLWAGDAWTFSEQIGVGFDETGQIVEFCPSNQYRLQDSVIDTSTSAPRGVEGLQRQFEIPLQGGRLVASITDFNPQNLFAIPGEVVWIGDDGSREVLLDRSIQLHTTEGMQSILVANPGYGPSPGAVYVIRQKDGGVELEALVQLPGPPMALLPLAEGRYAAVTRGDSVIVFDRDGIIGQAECNESAGAAAGK